MAMSGEIVGSGADASHCGGIYEGTSGVAVGVGEAVTVAVGVKVGGMGVAVGGTIICVTKLHDNKVRTNNPNKNRFSFICSTLLLVPVNLISV
jgi:hypothetical protein